MDSLSYRMQIPGTGWRVANDSPVWLKPRRTLWFVIRGEERIRDKAGRLRTFNTAADAANLMERLAREEVAS